jgi:hypothetical protein
MRRAATLGGVLLVTLLGLGGLLLRSGSSTTQSSGSQSSGSQSSVRRTWAGVRLPSVAFVVTCKLSHELPDDPILYPAKPGASHLHSFFGNRSTKATSSPSSMGNSASSCDDPLDRAAYWVPSPTSDLLRAYYDAGDADPATVSAFPSGLMGIAGSRELMQPGVGVAAFRCGQLGDGPDTAGWDPVPPTCDGNQPIVRFTFGQCLSASTGRLDVCKSGETPRYVRLRLLLEWQGANHSLGPHADFWNFWDEARLEELVAVCIRGERSSNLAIKQCRLPGTGPVSG